MTHPRTTPTAFLLFWVTLSAAGQDGAVPEGDQFQVNTYTTSHQLYPAVAAEAGGDFLVLWQSFGSNGGDLDVYGVQGQRFASGGSTVGGEFQVNTYTTSQQVNVAVAMESGGDFVAVWQSTGSGGGDSAGKSVQGQRHAGGGSALGGEFQVNTYTSSDQLHPAVGIDADGDFVVVWVSYGSYGGDSDLWSVQGQRYASDGSSAGSQFQVNTYTTSQQKYPAVAVDAGGGFVVVWESYGSDTGDSDRTSVQGRRYAADGSAVGGEFQVNTQTNNDQRFPAVAIDAGGGFVVAWQNDGGGPPSTESFGSWGIEAQRFASDGSPMGGELQVNTYTTDSQERPAVAVGADGDFVMVWSSNGSDTVDSDSWSVQGQRFDSDGSPLGSEFQVNTYTTNAQAHPSVAVDADGDFVVVWSSNGSDTGDSDSWSVQGQRFCHNVGPDTDDDGLADRCDADDDEDGILDGADNCPTDFNFDQTDTDGDGVGDVCDGDDDGDGVLDVNDLCILGEMGWTSGPATDVDGDGCRDAGEDTDDDNDGVPDGLDAESTDPSLCLDLDSDSCDDCAVGTDGFGPLADYDTANDGLDTDGDGACNAGDEDDDNDGVLDSADLCPLDPNPLNLCHVFGDGFESGNTTAWSSSVP